MLQKLRYAGSGTSFPGLVYSFFCLLVSSPPIGSTITPRVKISFIPEWIPRIGVHGEFLNLGHIKNAYRIYLCLNSGVCIPVVAFYLRVQACDAESPAPMCPGALDSIAYFMTSPIRFHGPFIMAAPSSPLQQPIQDTLEPELLHRVCRPEWIEIRYLHGYVLPALYSIARRSFKHIYM